MNELETYRSESGRVCAAPSASAHPWRADVRIASLALAVLLAVCSSPARAADNPTQPASGTEGAACTLDKTGGGKEAGKIKNGKCCSTADTTKCVTPPPPPSPRSPPTPGYIQTPASGGTRAP